MLSSFCTSRAAFVVYCTSVHKISLLYKCTQNQLTVQVYTRQVDCTSEHKTSFLSVHKTGNLSCLCLPLSKYTKLVTSKWYVQEWNITNYLSFLYLPLPTSFFLYLPLPASTFLFLPLPFSTCLFLSLPVSSFLYLPLPAFSCVPSV